MAAAINLLLSRTIDGVAVVVYTIIINLPLLKNYVGILYYGEMLLQFAIKNCN